MQGGTSDTQNSNSASANTGTNELEQTTSGNSQPQEDSSTGHILTASDSLEGSESGNTSDSSNTTTDNNSSETEETSENSGSHSSSSTDSPSTKPSVGTVIKDSRGNGCAYKITENSDGRSTVSFYGCPKSQRTLTVPSKVRYKGITYKVTAISPSAFRKSIKLKKVVIGSNIATIGKEAFKGCKNLKSIVIKGKSIKKIGKNAFSGISKKAVIKVPKKMIGKYRKMLKNAKLSKKVRIIRQ